MENATRSLWTPLVDTPYGRTAVCLEVCNTVSGTRDGTFKDDLVEYRSLLDWLAENDVFPPSVLVELHVAHQVREGEAREALQRVKRLREACWRVFSGFARSAEARPNDLDELALAFADASSHAKLRVEGNSGRVEWSDPGKHLDSPLWPIAVSAVELLTSPLLERVTECSSETCGWLFLDMSKNRRRRWCDMSSCGNRAKARQYRARKRRSS